MQTLIQPTPVSPESIQDIVAGLLQAGTNVTLTYNDVANTLTIAASSSTDTESIQDLVSAMFPDSPTIDFSYNDTSGVITATVIVGSITEQHINLVDVATDNADTSKHGFLPKLSGTTTTFLRGDGTWVAPTAATDTEAVQDIVGAMLTDSTTLDFTYDDTAGTATGIVKDASITEAKLLLADNTTQDVTTTRHGLVPKAPNSVTQFLDGTGAWSTPAGGGTSITNDGARIRRAAASVNIPNVTLHVVTFDTEDLDQAGYWTSGQPTRITVPQTGWYTVSAQIIWTCSANSGTRDVNLRVNGTDYRVVSRVAANGNADGHQLATGLMYMTTADYFEVVLYHGASGNSTVTGYVSIMRAGGSSGSSAPIDAQYLVAAGHTGLTSELVVTSAGLALLDDADNTAQRTTLGLGTMATQNANAVAITGGSIDGLSICRSQGNTAYMIPSGFAATDVTGNGVISFYSTLNSAGGTNRWAVYCAGTAASYFGGPVQVVGNVGIGAAPTTARLFLLFPAGTSAIQTQAVVAGTVYPLYFFNSGAGNVGSIATTDTATSYNTSSDVRLKHAIAPLTAALDRMRALRPISFKWNADDSDGVGFAANELQKVIPESVTGEPDAVHPDGSIRPQQVDNSKLVPWLVGAVKELMEQVETLTARLAALEA
jgi:hypothetical protein